MLEGMGCFMLIKEQSIDRQISIDLVMAYKADEVIRASDDQPQYSISMEWAEGETLENGEVVNGYFTRLTITSDPKYPDPVAKEHMYFIVVNYLGQFESIHKVVYEQTDIQKSPASPA